MRVLVLGGDGYLGWPTSMHLAAAGHEVMAVDNYARRRWADDTSSQALIANPRLPERAALFGSVSDYSLSVREADLSDPEVMFDVVKSFQPEAIIHYAEQPSAPFSMMGFAEAQQTLNNNLNVTFNVIWAVKEIVPDCHIIKLGTMGEYGTPNIDIEEGWLDVEHKGRKQTFLYPRQAGSLYHTTKVLDTDLLWFYVRTHCLRVTDLMQGPVYGISTPEIDLHPDLGTSFHYDDIFGTLVNRFVVQAVAGVPLTVFGKGGQTRGYLNLNDTLQCVTLAVESPVDAGELRILNQFTETFSVNDVAAITKRVGDELGLDVQVESIENPRKEPEDHYYNPAHSGLIELGLQPTFLTDDVMRGMLELVLAHREAIDTSRIFPRVKWS